MSMNSFVIIKLNKFGNPLRMIKFNVTLWPVELIIQPITLNMCVSEASFFIIYRHIGFTKLDQDALIQEIFKWIAFWRWKVMNFDEYLEMTWWIWFYEIVNSPSEITAGTSIVFLFQFQLDQLAGLLGTFCVAPQRSRYSSGVLAYYHQWSSFTQLSC